MREWQETRRAGTDVGPVDWAHPDIKESRIPETTLRSIEESPQQWTASCSGTRWGRILAFRMYDGWPFWTPRPAFMMDGWGDRWIFLYETTDVYRDLPSASPSPRGEEGPLAPEKGKVKP